MDGVERGGAVLFGMPEPRTGTERLVAIIETRLSDPDARNRLSALVQGRVGALTGIVPDDVVLSPPHSIPRTASGKIRRLAARENYAASGAMGVSRPPRWQLARIVIAAFAPIARRAASMAGAWLYAGYWWAVLCAFGAVVWPLVVLLPSLSWRWALLHRAARWMLRLQGTPLTVDVEKSPLSGNAVIAVNHSSYFDGAPLLAALPGEPVIAVAREFASRPLIGPFLKALDVFFVERFEPRAGLEVTERAAALARAGALLVFFPEATYTRLPGLAEFRLGAFRVAAETNRPVVPVVIRGTRSVLRGGQWFPRRAPLSVWIGAPIHPKGRNFAAAIALRDEVRHVMLSRTGEPDLAPAFQGLRH